MDRTATETVEAYYDALSSGEPLAPFFADRSDLVKFGISERLEGFSEVERGLREQTETTTDWAVESRNLIASEADGSAWFSDEVRMEWTDTETGERRAFETRWSGTLRLGERWRFVGMHVSVPREL
ncbi:nuclear transport factor 2 family protein [Natronorarus salvus]|uniref:nuclear transport factor 2 family protein n=1 Tax=Natronorarus salvus TaxID=3117733 RepID=UPI002F267F06